MHSCYLTHSKYILAIQPTNRRNLVRNQPINWLGFFNFINKLIQFGSNLYMLPSKVNLIKPNQLPPLGSRYLIVGTIDTNVVLGKSSWKNIKVFSDLGFLTFCWENLSWKINRVIKRCKISLKTVCLYAKSKLFEGQKCPLVDIGTYLPSYKTLQPFFNCFLMMAENGTQNGKNIYLFLSFLILILFLTWNKSYMHSFAYSNEYFDLTFTFLYMNT